MDTYLEREEQLNIAHSNTQGAGVTWIDVARSHSIFGSWLFLSQQPLSQSHVHHPPSTSPLFDPFSHLHPSISSYLNSRHRVNNNKHYGHQHDPLEHRPPCPPQHPAIRLWTLFLPGRV